MCYGTEEKEIWQMHGSEEKIEIEWASVKQERNFQYKIAIVQQWQISAPLFENRHCFDLHCCTVFCLYCFHSHSKDFFF